jgi:rRNA maturation endonuclease Nob1
MPRSLTAKNGSKYTFSGEYKIRIEMKCSACYFDEPDPDCEVCGGGIDYIHTETLELTLIKEIYAKAVEALGQEVFEGKDHLGAVKKLNESKEYCAVCGGGLALSRHND